MCTGRIAFTNSNSGGSPVGKSLPERPQKRVWTTGLSTLMPTSLNHTQPLRPSVKLGAPATVQLSSVWVSGCPGCGRPNTQTTASVTRWHHYTTATEPLPERTPTPSCKVLLRPHLNHKEHGSLNVESAPKKKKNHQTRATANASFANVLYYIKQLKKYIFKNVKKNRKN